MGIIMDRFILKSSLTLALVSFMGIQSAPCSMPGGFQMVFDPQSFAEITKGINIATDSLVHLQEASGFLQKMNTLLGTELNTNFLQGLGKFDGYSNEFKSVLSAVNGNSGDRLMALNNVAHVHGAQDFSNYLYAKQYMQQKFFPTTQNGAAPDIQKIQSNKMEAVRTSTVDSLALATQQKTNLEKDSQRLEDLTRQAEQNSSLIYQASIHNKLLEQIAHRLDKLILIQSQQLELMAAYMAHAQPSVYRRVGGKMNQE
jgi:hypothetical protein